MFPISSYSRPEKLRSNLEASSQELSPKLAKLYQDTCHLMFDFIDIRPCIESMGAQNLYAFKQGVKTTQDDLHITKRTNSMWFKTREEIKDVKESTAALR